MAPAQKKENVLVIGASENPDRYSFKAIELLKTYGHFPIGISPQGMSVLGVPGFKKILDFKAICGQVDTITMYVNPKLSVSMIDDILKAKPKRIIFNPGTENPAIYPQLQAAGIEVEEACTLVLLRTNQY